MAPAPPSLLLLGILFLIPNLSNAYTSAAAVNPQISVWPKPISVEWLSPASAPLSPSFRILLLDSISTHPVLRSAARRYSRRLLTERHRPIVPPPVPTTLSPLLYLTVSVAQPSAPLQHGADESYALHIPSSSSVAGAVANLTAATPWGAIRGLETLSQLAWWTDGRVLVAAGLQIEDWPLFPYRGLLIDTSRNFYPVRDLLRTIDAMAACKMNVFHWHASDSHSFPVELPSEPDLAAKGSYGEEFRYSTEDVRKVVSFARKRGVRVIPEFDAPGHAGSWAGAYPEIVTCAGQFWSPPGSASLAAEPGTGQLNPLHPMTYQVLQNVLRDAAGLFPDTFLHAGGDEVSPGCWQSDASITRYLSSGGTLNDLLTAFVNATHPFITSALGRTAVYWEDVLLSDSVRADPSVLPKETTVLQTWNNGPNNTKRVVSAGYRAIVSSADFYYLDCGHGGWVGNDSRYDEQVPVEEPGPSFNYGGGGGSWCAPFKTWQRVYDYDITYGLSEAEAELVLGGEVALWSEQADGAVVDSRVWPRAAAMAEALWSGNRDGTGRKRYAEATDRLSEWRERMVGRGVAAEPIQPRWCAYNPGMCNLDQ